MISCVTKKGYRIEYRNKNKQFHNEDGPAIIWDSGDMEWFNNGILHRLDGPAVMRGLGVYWAINNQFYLEEEFNEHPEVIRYKMENRRKLIKNILNNAKDIL
jgi:hypothetical protein